MICVYKFTSYSKLHYSCTKLAIQSDCCDIVDWKKQKVGATDQMWHMVT